MEVDWQNLEALPLSLIFDKLVERLDHIYFGVVCKNWYSIAKFNYQNRQIKNNVLPMLMIPTNIEWRTKRSLYGISSNTIYNFQLQVRHKKRFCGSSHGWLAKVERSKVATITLLNPFKNLDSICLPRIYMPMIQTRGKIDYEGNIHKVILSTNPTIRPHDYVVAVIYSMRKSLAFIKAGQEVWTYVDDSIKDHCCFGDVIFYKGLIYAVGHWNNIVSFDICYSKYKRVIPNVVSSGGDVYADRAYLVKSLEGELWLVKKFIDFSRYNGYVHNSSGTQRFEVYKLELNLQTGKLIQMLKLDSLGDNVLFLGDNDSVSLSASYFSKYLQKNSIYYTDDY
jgi:hypothetical protein